MISWGVGGYHRAVGISWDVGNVTLGISRGVGDIMGR